MTDTKKPEEKIIKRPHHVAVAQRHLVAQRLKAIAIRDRAGQEVDELDAALLALGWEGDE